MNKSTVLFETLDRTSSTSGFLFLLTFLDKKNIYFQNALYYRNIHKVFCQRRPHSCNMQIEPYKETRFYTKVCEHLVANIESTFIRSIDIGLNISNCNLPSELFTFEVIWYDIFYLVAKIYQELYYCSDSLWRGEN